MAEGESGGPRGQADLCPDREHLGRSPARRASRLLFEDGTPRPEPFPLSASSRTNMHRHRLPGDRGKRFGTLIETQGATPAQIVVERAMYSNANGVIWAAGTNALATRLQ